MSVLNPALLLVIFVGAAVKEGILLSRVSVKITVKQNLPLSVHVPDEHFREVDWRVEEPIRFVPLSVEVTAKQRASVVSIDDSVGVEHGHYPEHKVLSELLCLRTEKIF